MGHEIEPNSLVHVVANDLTSHENEAWVSSEDALLVTPEIVEILGFFIGEGNGCVYLSQAICDSHHANLFIIPRGQILSIHTLPRPK